MPTNRRARLKPRKAALTPGQRTELIHGFLLDGEEGFASDAERRAAWVEFTHILTPEFCRKFPGRMPHGFWTFDAPGANERGFFGVREGHESEDDHLTRCGLIEQVKKLGYVEPQPTRGLTFFEYDMP